MEKCTILPPDNPSSTGSSIPTNGQDIGGGERGNLAIELESILFDRLDIKREMIRKLFQLATSRELRPLSNKSFIKAVGVYST